MSMLMSWIGPVLAIVFAVALFVVCRRFCRVRDERDQLAKKLTAECATTRDLRWLVHHMHRSLKS